MNVFWIVWSSTSPSTERSASPSSVRTVAPSGTESTRAVHDRTGTTSTMTVQAPHCATPHPNFGPCWPSCSRSTYNS